MVRDSYNLKVRVKSTCPSGELVLDQIDKGTASAIKSCIGAEREDGAVALYIDSDVPDNLYGIVKEATGKSGDLDDSLVDQLVVDGNYEIKLLSREKQVITARLDILKADGSASGASDVTVNEKLQKLIDEKIAEGVVTKEDMDARIKVMKENHVDEFLMYRVIKQYRKYEKAVEIPNCIYVDPFLDASLKKHEEPLISEILRCLVSRNAAILFEGEKSVGKNVCAKTIAWLLGKPRRVFVGSRQMTPSMIYGDKTTDNSAMAALNMKNAVNYAVSKIKVMMNPESATADDIRVAAEYDLLCAKAASTNVIIEATAVYEWLVDGGVLELDEMNLFEANLLASFLNPILDGTGYLTIPGRGEIPVNEDCVLIGTQNADYAGVEEQNEATMSRMACVRFRQPETISGLLKNAVKAKLEDDEFPGVKIDTKYITQVDRFYSACRTSMEQGLISNAVMNIRGFVRALAAVFESDGHCRLARQVELHVLNTCPLNEADSLRGVLKSHITL